MARTLGLSITVQRETSLLRQRVDFTISGRRENVLTFLQCLQRFVDEWNEE